MKSYTITVNGNVYDVTVEENGVATPTAAAAPRKAAVSYTHLDVYKRQIYLLRSGKSDICFKIMLYFRI